MSGAAPESRFSHHLSHTPRDISKTEIFGDLHGLSAAGVGKARSKSQELKNATQSESEDASRGLLIESAGKLSLFLFLFLFTSTWSYVCSGVKKIKSALTNYVISVLYIYYLFSPLCGFFR